MSDRRPNILLIVTDQQRADTIAALGNDIIKTPNLDRLAREGTAFRRHYTSCPVCGPARGSLATGLAPHKGLQTDNFVGPALDLPDFATLLHDAGYQTMACGGPHEPFGVPKTRTPEGERSSLDAFDRCLTSADYHRWFAEQGLDWVQNPRGRGTEYYYIPQTMRYPEQYSKPHWTVDNSIRMLQERDPDQPFLMSTQFGAPHPPWEVPYPWDHLYRPNQMPHPLRPANFREYRCRANLFQNRYKWMEQAVEGGDDLLLRRIRAAYCATISHVDAQIGRLLEALGDEIDNTLVLFTTDHGEMLGDYGCVGKRCMLEGAVRVSMLARLPGFMPEGREVRGATSTMDVMPTMLEAAGVDCPELPEGRSLRECTDLEPGERVVFSQFSRAWNGQYFAADGEHAYWHSAADKREWHFKTGDEVAQGDILPIEGRAAELRQALIERHDPSADVYSDAVEDGQWKDHEVPASPLHSDPDCGYLFTGDEQQVQADIDALGPGYARKATEQARGHLMQEHMVVPTEEEWEQMGHRAPWLDSD